MDRFKRYNNNPVLRYIKLSQFLGILPFRIVAAKETSIFHIQSELSDRSLQITVGSENRGVNYEVEWSSSLMIWCVTVRVLLIGGPLMYVLQVPSPNVTNGNLLTLFVNLAGIFCMCFRAADHKVVLNSLMNIMPDEKESRFKFEAGVTIEILAMFFCIILDSVRFTYFYLYFFPLEKILNVCASIIAFSWLLWGTHFYKHLCSYKRFEIMKIQHKLRKMENDDEVCKLLDAVIQVCFIYLIVLLYQQYLKKNTYFKFKFIR